MVKFQENIAKFKREIFFGINFFKNMRETRTEIYDYIATSY